MLTRSLLETVAECQPPATRDVIEAVQLDFSGRLPAEYLELLSCCDGLVSRTDVTLYSASDLAERNGTYEVQRYAPDLLMIGDDGGGRGVFLSGCQSGDQAVSVVMVGHGAIGADSPRILATSLEAWAEQGFSLLEE